jgi:hypothetical protein
MDQQRTAAPRARAMPTAGAGLSAAAVTQAEAHWAEVTLKWRDLAERRRAHFIDLYKSGRWKHYYTDNEFREELGRAVAIAQRWARIAPRPGELKPPGMTLPPPQAA